MESVDGSAASDRGLQTNGHVDQDAIGQAQAEIGKITAIAQVAASALDAAQESQAAAATAAAEAKAKSTEISTTADAVAGARDAAIASQSAAATAAIEAQAKVVEINTVSQAAGTARDAALASQSAAAAATTEAQAKVTEITATSQAAVTARDAAIACQAAAATAATEAQAKATEVAGIATQALGAQTQIADLQAIIATKSGHINDAQVHADNVRANLDRTLTAATQQATEAEALKARAQSAADKATGLLGEIRTTTTTVDTEVAAAVTARQTAEESAVVTKGLAEKSVAIEERIARYERRLAELQAESEDRLKQIVEFLPGAASAGLANAWDLRRQTFLGPQKRWQGIFVVSLSFIAVLALSGLVEFYWPQIQSLIPVPLRTWMGWPAIDASAAADPLSLNHLLRVWLARVPAIGVLIWLAFHASSESSLAKRLEEEYGFKATTAAAFVGFKDMMASVSQNGGESKLLANLCENTLKTMATPPGRIYEKHKLVHTPLNQLAQLVEAAGKAAKNVKPDVPGM